MTIAKGEHPDVNPDKRIGQKQKKGSGPRIGNSERTLPADQLNRAQVCFTPQHNTDNDNRLQGSPTKGDIEDEPVTPMKTSKGEHPDTSPGKKISQTRKKGSGPGIGNSANPSPTECFA
ncbi:hypothetical protein JVT61DRAFT_1401 [Boletus reticuloceps]|uniref:Uncharacterized protein n=1 Tax=Boletus reticuloceps TaxID=495285 RepID=A0A8I2YC32_9AGAM|nr:hypothetical protein JVT61DRAFT_1401 [Boletus reticuloceps]